MSDSATDSAVPSRSVLRTRTIIFVAAGLLSLYLLSPYFSFWRFAAAIEGGDSEALAERVDFGSVRASLKEQLRQEFIRSQSKDKATKANRFAGMIANFAPTLIDALVDAYVTPSGIAALIAHPPGGNDLQSLSNLQRQQQTSARKDIDFSKVKYAFFTNPTHFMIESQGMKLRFGFTGLGWKLQRIELPLHSRTP